MGIGTLRRYRRMKVVENAAERQIGAAAAFEAKRRATPATPLPDPFINARVRAALLEATPTPYDSLEDLQGATVEELTRVPGIGTATAERIIAEVDALLGG